MPKNYDYILARPGFTLQGMRVVSDEVGEVVPIEDCGEGFKMLSPQEQRTRFGRVLYEGYEPDEEEMPSIEARRRVVYDFGMQAPTEPPVRPADLPTAAPAPLETMSLGELRGLGRRYGLQFPAETSLTTMVKVITRLRQKEAEAATMAEEPDEEEIDNLVEQARVRPSHELEDDELDEHRQRAGKAITKANRVAAAPRAAEAADDLEEDEEDLEALARAKAAEKRARRNRTRTKPAEATDSGTGPSGGEDNG